MQRLPNGRARRRQVLAVAAAITAASCSRDSVSVSGVESRTLSAPVGVEVTVTLQTIGPGEYASPPEVSSAALAYFGVEQADAAVPAGPTQRFRFRAAARGTAVVTFRHTGQGRTVQDTVQVR